MSLANFQNEIYLNGLLGAGTPDYPVDVHALQQAAHEVMTPEAIGYVTGSAGAEDTYRANREAFDRWRLVPRMLRGIPGVRDLATTVLGTSMPAPVLLAPIGVLEIVHPEAELAVARAAAGLGLPFILSTAASNTLEAVAAEADSVQAGAPKWYQLYWPNDRELAASFVRRAEAAGYEAVVFTMDTWQLGWRPRDLQTAYLPFLQAQGVANYFTDPVFRAGLEKSPEDDQGPAVMKFLGLFSDPSLTWDDLAWLREQTTLPIVLKGVQHPDDVRRAADAGVQAVVCSNHGGRQVDGAIGSLEALPAVVEAAGDLPVLFDSGVRTGADAAKALALGAQAVLLGRPYVYGLALGGAEGVMHALRCFLADFDLQLGLSGHRTPAELSHESLQRRP